jgi:hypothetical protein
MLKDAEVDYFEYYRKRHAHVKRTKQGVEEENRRRLVANEKLAGLAKSKQHREKRAHA